MAQQPREPVFSKKLFVFLTQEQDDWLAREVKRRKDAGVTSDVAAAHGGNPNVNKSTLLREGLEMLRSRTK